MSQIIKLRNIKGALRIVPDKAVDYLLSGRISRFRPYKRFNFIDLSDGSTNEHLQAVIKRELLDKPELGSYITCLGSLTSSPGTKQNIELKVNKLEYIGHCDPLKYPLATGSTLSNDWYRRYIHLRPRAPHFASLLRVKSELELSLHMIMRQMDFFRVHTPIMTSNDSESSSDLFIVKRSKIDKQFESKSDDDETDLLLEGNDTDSDLLEDKEDYFETDQKRVVRDDYFNKDVFMVTSAQLHLENLAASLSRVYTVSSSFRAENSISTRHLCEFLMFEAEEANVTDLETLMNRVETIIKFIAQFLDQVSEYKSDFGCLIELNSNKKIYDKLAHSAYIRMTYTEALSILKYKAGFSGDTNYGCDVGRLHEKALLDYCDNVPIFITNYPKELKPFYMKCDNQDKEALCFDLIGAHGGEICGGSLREDSMEKLLSNMRGYQAEHLNHFNWYLDSRRFGPFPHGGFGVGLERLLQSLLGVKNIKDTTACPRWSGHCPM